MSIIWLRLSLFCKWSHAHYIWLWLCWQNVNIQSTIRNQIKFCSWANSVTFTEKKGVVWPWCLSTKVIIFGETDREKEDSPLAIIPYSVLGIISACPSKKFTAIIFLAHMINSWICYCVVAKSRWDVYAKLFVFAI